MTEKSGPQRPYSFNFDRLVGAVTGHYKIARSDLLASVPAHLDGVRARAQSALIYLAYTEAVHAIPLPDGLSAKSFATQNTSRIFKILAGHFRTVDAGVFEGVIARAESEVVRGRVFSQDILKIAAAYRPVKSSLDATV